MNWRGPASKRSQSSNLGQFSYKQQGKLDYSVVTKADSSFAGATLAPPGSGKRDDERRLSTGSRPRNDPLRQARGQDRCQLRLHLRSRQACPRLAGGSPGGGSFWRIPKYGRRLSSSCLLLRRPATFNWRSPLIWRAFVQTLDNIRNETGVSGQTYSLTIQADVTLTGNTDAGPINETFSPTITTSLEKGMIQWEGDFIQTKPGSIEVSRIVPNTGQVRRDVDPNGQSGYAPLAGCFCARLRVGPVDDATGPNRTGYLKQKKKAAASPRSTPRGCWTATAQTPGFGEKTVTVSSIDDLVKVADELGKPIVHQAAGASRSSHIYYVMDGLTCYRYLIPDGVTECRWRTRRYFPNLARGYAEPFRPVHHASGAGKHVYWVYDDHKRYEFSTHAA